MADLANPILDSIKKRRTVTRFETRRVEEEKIQAILEAARWAPSWLNSQPWRLILVKDRVVKARISELVPTIFSLGVKEAPVCIVVCVDTKEDPYHFIEDGAAATQNMALAAHSLGLGSCWIGVFNLKGEKESSEEKIRKILRVPEAHRVISVLPVGVPKSVPEKERKDLSELVHLGMFRT